MVSAPLKALQSPEGLMDVLVYLSGQDAAFAKQAMTDLKMNRGTFYACIEKLRYLGFVFERKEIGYPIHAYYGLTRKGQDLANHLAPLAKAMEGSLENLQKELDLLERGAKTRRGLKRQLDILDILLNVHFRRAEWGELMKDADKARAVAGELGDGSRIAAVELMVGKALQKKGDNRCLAHLDFAAREAVAVRAFAVAAEAAYVRGCHYERRGRFARAEKEFRQCGRLATRAKSGVNLGRAELGAGRVLVETSRHPAALERLHRARELLVAEDAEEELAGVYANLGAATFSKDPREALDWHERAIRACELGGFLRLEVSELGNAATCLQKIGDLKRARQHLARAEDIAVAVEDPKLTAGLRLQSAFLDVGLGDLGAAEEGARGAVEVAKGQGLPRELAHAHYLLGDTLAKRGQLTAAQQSLEEAKVMFQRLRDEEMVRRLTADLAKLRR